VNIPLDNKSKLRVEYPMDNLPGCCRRR